MATESVLLPWIRATRTGVVQNEQTNDESLRLTWTNDKTVTADRATVVSQLYAISHTVDPAIDDGRVTYSGVWRNAGCGWDGRTQSFFIELRKGWATTTPEEMAVYVNVIRSNQSGKLTLVRKWQFIDPGEVEKLIKSSNANGKVLANTVTDPMADGKTYEGEWLAITTEGPKTAQDGCTIIQTLIKAGDANLTVILGTNKMTSSRECYKWQTTAEDLEAFRTHTGVYATEFDYKWPTSETGIQKDWQPSQNGDDKSLNLVARYIVKESWLYPANGTDFVLISNLNGFSTESVRKFRNQAAIPVAKTGELVKALEDELGQFSGEVIKRAITAGGGTGYVTASSSIYEWDVDKTDFKYPVYTTSTDSDVPQRVTGFNMFQARIYNKRLVTVKVSRTYSATHPAVTPVSEAIAGDRGACVNRISQMINLPDGLFAIETKTITIGSWDASPNVTYVPIIYVPA